MPNNADQTTSFENMRSCVVKLIYIVNVILTVYLYIVYMNVSISKFRNQRVPYSFLVLKFFRFCICRAPYFISPKKLFIHVKVCRYNIQIYRVFHIIQLNVLKSNRCKTFYYWTPLIQNFFHQPPVILPLSSLFIFRVICILKSCIVDDNNKTLILCPLFINLSERRA